MVKKKSVFILVSMSAAIVMSVVSIHNYAQLWSGLGKDRNKIQVSLFVVQISRFKESRQ